MDPVFEALAPLHKDWNVSVTTILEGWKQEDFWSSLASWLSLIYELQVYLETLSQGNKVERD